MLGIRKRQNISYFFMSRCFNDRAWGKKKGEMGEELEGVQMNKGKARANI